MSNQDVLVTDIAEVYVADGILYVKFLADELKIVETKAHIAAVKARFGEHLPLPGVIDNGKAKAASKEIRDYFASDEVGSVISASAIVMNSVVTKIAINLFLQFSKPKYPVKLFTEVDKAVEWANQFKK
jgi:hypothetical protein